MVIDPIQRTPEKVRRLLRVKRLIAYERTDLWRPRITYQQLETTRVCSEFKPLKLCLKALDLGPVLGLGDGAGENLNRGSRSSESSRFREDVRGRGQLVPAKTHGLPARLVTNASAGAVEDVYLSCIAVGVVIARCPSECIQPNPNAGEGLPDQERPQRRKWKPCVIPPFIQPNVSVRKKTKVSNEAPPPQVLCTFHTRLLCASRSPPLFVP